MVFSAAAVLQNSVSFGSWIEQLTSMCQEADVRQASFDSRSLR
jgi:hypothetical protein